MVTALNNNRWTTADIPDVAIKGFFAAVSEAVRYFNIEAAWNQNVAANYLRIGDMAPEKQALWDVYHGILEDHMDTIYGDSSRRLRQCLDHFGNVTIAQQDDLDWLGQDDSIKVLITNLKDDLQAKLGIIEQLFDQVQMWWHL